MFDKKAAIIASKQLRLQADCLHVLTLAPQDALPRARMIELLQHELMVLRQKVVEHFASEEQGVYLTVEHPDLVERCLELRRQHTLLIHELASLVTLANEDPDLTEFSERITSLIELLDAHESAEHDFIAGMMNKRRNGESERPARMG